MIAPTGYGNHRPDGDKGVNILSLYIGHSDVRLYAPPDKCLLDFSIPQWRIDLEPWELAPQDYRRIFSRLPEAIKYAEGEIFGAIERTEQ